ncbi:TPA: hypothetical protein OXO77_004239 [Acinetobacter baumannii]|uniref:DUF6236 family protein n=1 Tax=Acinetobacter baumannii TaxID=470 RepID=UPI002296AC48|nr:DUF6236 family protein [Acinetobacter baumannii]EKU3623973.1 hypothetical protein [Acinetobacter baumannii]EKU3624222.1 hypothetical protein [Acinetobacter baumannii]EKU3631930.1 hypothetical protein [Acinetobacter baumannii]EKU5995139.1 hypothetical protein [Acinetobacter baumannii]EKV9950451.1 hypothetical protein [Acinetobacter baumannii]
MKKGILITSPKEISIGGGISFSSLDRREVRKALTYWDEIAYLTNNVVYQSDNEIEELKKFGVASELNTPLIGSIRGNQEFINFIKFSEINTINSKIKENPAYWSVANNSYFDRNEEYLADAKELTLEIELYQTLPVPSADTPLEKIIEFKEKRGTEILAFREYFEDLVIDICDSKSFDRKKNLEIERVKRSLLDIDRVMKEGKIKIIYDNLRNIVKKDFLEISGYTATTSGLTAYGVYLTPQLHAFSPMLVGMAACGIAIGSKYINKPQTHTQFNYIRSIRKNFQDN